MEQLRFSNERTNRCAQICILAIFLILCFFSQIKTINKNKYDKKMKDSGQISFAVVTMVYK
jgi:hypothetical protein